MLVADADVVAVVGRDRGRPRGRRLVTPPPPPPTPSRSPEWIAVRVLLAVKGWTQATLAKQIDTTEPYLHHLLAGKLPHRTDLWQKVWLTLLTPGPEAK